MSLKFEQQEDGSWIGKSVERQKKTAAPKSSKSTAKETATKKDEQK